MVGPADAPLSCYISSPLLVDTTALRELLVELGVTPIAIDELPTAGQAIAPTLQSWMRSASFVCAVLPAKQSANIFFEIGLALGLGRPVFTIAEESADIPVPIERLPYVKASLADIDSIRFHLEAFLASLPKRSRRITAAAAPVVSSPQRSYGGEAVPIDSKNISRLGLESEREVADLLGSVSTQVTLGAPVGERFEADMLIWLRDLDIGQGGPVLVEIKLGAKEQWPTRALRQIAILVTNAPDAEMTAYLAGGGIVFSISIDGLRHEIAAGTLLDALRRLRNRIFHGVA
jgi:hypothetical protein